MTSLQNPRTSVIAAIGLIFLSAVVLSCSRGKEEARPQGQEVVSKRVKIELKDLPAEPQTLPPIATPAPPAPSAPEEVAVKAEGKAVPSTTTPPIPSPVPALKDGPKALTEVPKAAPVAQPARPAPSAKDKAPKALAKTAVRTAGKKRPEKEGAKTRKPSATLTEAMNKPWAVNVASFSNIRDAEGMKEVLRKSGYKSYTMEFKKDGKKWYRVRVGFYKNREDAAKAAGTIGRTFGIPTTPWVVKPPLEEIISRR